MVTKTGKFTLKSEVPTIKSRAKFSGDYRKELDTIMEILEEVMELELEKYFSTVSITPGNTNLKIRLRDAEKEPMILNCVFRYHHNDTKFGNINIDFVSSGFAKKPTVHMVGKFSIIDHETIKTKVLEDLIAGVTNQN